MTASGNGDKTMKKLNLITLLILAIAVFAFAVQSQNSLPPEVREMARKVMMPVVLRVPGMTR